MTNRQQGWTPSILVVLLVLMFVSSCAPSPSGTDGAIGQTAGAIRRTAAADAAATSDATKPPAAYPPPATTTPAAPPPGSLAARIGVQIFEADIDTSTLDELQAIGVQWARTRVLWKLAEPADTDPPTYDWTVTDRFFSEVAARRMRNITSVYANPDWVTDRECMPVPTDKMSRWSGFVEALVERYDGDGMADAPGSPRVEWWEVGNEADFDASAAGAEGDYGSCAGDDPAAYGAQLMAASEAAKKADPTARIVLGPVAYDRFTPDSAPGGWSGSPGPFSYSFTQDVLDSVGAIERQDGSTVVHGARSFDAVGLHHYNDNAEHWAARGENELGGHVSDFNLQQLLSLADPNRADRVPLLLTEVGLATGPSDEWTIRTDEMQGWYVPQALIRAMFAGVDLAIWYTARDNLMGDCEAPHYDWLTFGLMRSEAYGEAVRGCPELADAMAYPLEAEGTSRPALQAMATLIREMGRAEIVSDYIPYWSDGPDQPDPTQVALDVPPEVEAYEVNDGDRRVIVAWTDTGKRLGARDTEPVTATLVVDASSAVVTSHLGEKAELVGEDGFVRVPVGAAPVYVEVQP